MRVPPSPPDTILPNSAVNDGEKAPDRVMLGILLRLAAMATLAIMFALVKLAAAQGVHVAESLFWRQLTGLPAVILWLWWSNDLASVKTAHPGKHAMRMTLGLSGMLLNFTAMILLPMAQAATIGFAMPIFATLLAAIILREKTGRYRWGAVIFGFAGVALAIGPSMDVAPIGGVIALTGALMTAGVTIQLRRMSQTESTGAIVFWFSLTSLIPLGIAMLFFSQNHGPLAWAYIAGLSIAGALGQLLLTGALRYAPVAAILPMDYSSLIWTTILGFFIFGNLPGTSLWFGAALIIAAGLLIAWREHHLARTKTA